MQKRELRITKVSTDQIGEAQNIMLEMYSKTKRYDSTRVMVEHVNAMLSVLKTHYAAHVGEVIERGDRFPYSIKEWREARTSARMVYNYARNNKTKSDPLGARFQKVDRVIGIAEERARYVGGL